MEKLNFEELKSNAYKAAIEKSTLEEQSENLQNQILQKMKDNYDNCLRYEINTMWDYVQRLSRVAKTSVSVNKYNSQEYEEIEPGAFYVTIYTARDSYDSDFKIGVSGRTHINGAPKFDCFNYDKYLLPYLETEEKALETLEVIKQYFALWFKRFVAEIEPKNEELKKQVEKLTEALSSTHCVEEHEDGSIEIQLNGKTYVGTVKEQ